MFRKTVVISLWLGLIFWMLGNPGFATGYSPKVGEVLRYRVMVKSVIHGGDQTSRVVARTHYHNREVFRIQSTMTTVGLVRKLHPYQETEELLLDAEGLYPLLLKREIQDKNGLETEEVRFDYERRIAVRQHAEKGSPPVQTELALPGYVHDALSLQYFLRKNRFDGKMDQKIYFYANGKIREVVYDVTQVHTRIELECGTYSSYYEVDNDDIVVLIADTPERYPLLIRKMAKFGKIEARLMEIDGG